MLGTLLDGSVHAKVVVLTSDRPPGEEVPQNAWGSGSERGPLPAVWDVGCGGYLCACRHEIQSPVSTKHTCVGPGRVSSHVQTPS